MAGDARVGADPYERRELVRMLERDRVPHADACVEVDVDQLAVDEAWAEVRQPQDDSLWVPSGCIRISAYWPWSSRRNTIQRPSGE